MPDVLAAVLAWISVSAADGALMFLAWGMRKRRDMLSLGAGRRRGRVVRRCMNDGNGIGEDAMRETNTVWIKRLENNGYAG